MLSKILYSMLLAWCAYAAIAVYLHRSMIYPFQQDPHGFSRGKSASVGDIPVTIHEGNPGAPAIFYLQGNVASRAYFREVIEGHAAAGFTVVSMNYLGSEGRPGAIREKDLKSEALEVFRAIESLTGIPPERTLVHGYSLGSGIAMHVAAHGKPGALALQASYSSLCELMFKRSTVPACLLPMVDRWDNRKLVAKLETPVLLMHGKRDELIPVAFAERLLQHLIASGKDVRFITYADATHTDFSTTDLMHQVHDMAGGL